MGKRSRWMLVVLTCVLVFAGAVVWMKRGETNRKSRPAASDNVSEEVFLDTSWFSDGGFLLAARHTGEIRDPSSLDDLRAAIAQRGPRALAALQEELADLERSPPSDGLEIPWKHFQISTILAYQDRFDEALATLERSLAMPEMANGPMRKRAILTAVLGLYALRQGEIDNCINCVGPSSCIFPIAGSAVHTRPAGSRKAVECFTKYLEMVPGDLRVRWLLNLAYMTLGEYPDKVPGKFLIPLDTFASTAEAGRFQNVASLVGLTARAPNQAGGSLFDDFTGDGLPDLFVTSLDVDRGAALYVNSGDGRFEDRSSQAGLDNQIYALNLARADFDNDGNLDVVLLRGGWEKAMRLSLLRNTGNGVFEDVTISAGLAEPIATESAAWGDYDNDGLVDLFVCGEYLAPLPGDQEGAPEPQNRCRLYHNEGRGKFVDVASVAGVAEEQCSKGCAWGDYDGDGRLDLFVSNMNAPCRLYHNEGNGTFRDVAAKLNVTGPEQPFACWFWDYDNDGRLDLYVNDYSSALAHFAAASLKIPYERTGRPRLYQNVGAAGFRDVTNEVGLDRDFMPMGANFGDIDNDGFLDIYLGTGRMTLEALVPNVMLKNQAGRRFDDVTTSSGTGHLQKGHGVSFADWDHDGDLDLFVVAGGAVPGDRSYNLLFQNPGPGRHHWLKIKLVGVKTNRAALGARIQVVLRDADGKERSIHRTVGNNGSFGGNCLVETIGLADATSIARLDVTWPTSQTTQSFRDIAADQAIEVTEGEDSFKPLAQPPLPAPRPAN